MTSKPQKKPSNASQSREQQPTQQVLLNNPPIPAIVLPLTGQHLIEASAGTGKTWTLTGLVLRLIVEAGQPCDKIIATTFTKSAAAEMRQRIRERLQDFYRLLRVLLNHSYADALNDATTLEQALDALQHWLEQQTSNMTGLADAVKDPINQHLVRYIATAMWADKFATDTDKNIQSDDKQKKSDNADKPKRPTLNFHIALQRTNSALNQLDRLFVSTLDSLCQKWLREFSSETGFSAEVQISNDVSPMIAGMVHDQLRAFWAQIHQQAPEIYQLLQATGKLDLPANYHDVVEKAFNFYTAPIDYFVVKPLDLAQVNTLMQRIAEGDSEFEPYLDEGYRLEKGFAKKNLHNKFDEFYHIQTLCQRQDLAQLLKLKSSFLEAMIKLFDDDEGFKKGFQSQKMTFINVSMTQQLYKLAKAIADINEHLADLGVYFSQFISRYVREHLAHVLEAQRLTTFSLQLARLNSALQGKKGEALARYIRHQYPIALIDESQDINTEQALLIQRIYLDKSIDADKKSQDKKDSGFLLLVGDPKQAIYGFRGGDVHNYTTLKKQFANQPLTLTQNRRSAQRLIDSLNHWYGVTDDETINIQDENLSKKPYFLGEEIVYQAVSATREHSDLRQLLSEAVSDDLADLPAMYQLKIGYKQPLPTPVESPLESVTNDDAEFISVADAVSAQILALFDTKNGAFLLENRRLKLDDICVLAVKNKDLTDIENHLHQRGIATLRGGNQSVFGDVMSEDLLTLMATLLTPHHKAKIKTLLLSRFFGLDLTEATLLLEHAEQNEVVNSDSTQHGVAGLAKLAERISDMLLNASQLWQKNGFLSTIQWFLTQSLSLPNQPEQTFWQRLASHANGERLLIDLRQLLDILSEQFSGQQVGEYQLYDWYCTQRQTLPKDEWALQQRLSSESGVHMMTIHRAKGLEFPIVFVVGLDKNTIVTNSRPKHGLYLYSTANASNPLLSRRLSARKQDGEMDFEGTENTMQKQEAYRLAYVALTRARERLYLVTAGQYQTQSSSPLINFVENTKEFNLKEHLGEAVTVVDLNSLSKYFDKQLTFAQVQPKNLDEKLRIAIDYANDKIKHTHFKGWANTSFTALSRYVSQQQYDSVVHEADYDGLANDVLTDVSLDDDSLDIDNELDDLTMQAGDLTANSVNNAVKSTTIIKGLNPKPRQPQLQFNQAIDASVWSAPPNFEQGFEQGFEQDFEQSFEPNLEVSFDNPFEPNFDGWFADDSNAVEWDYAVDETDIGDFYQTFNPDSVTSGAEAGVPDYPSSIPIEDNWQPVDRGGVLLTANDVNPQNSMPNYGQNPLEEQQLLRFRFEKGASAGTFLHKVLEDLANSPFDTFAQNDGTWLPPRRWAVIIDRALRRQQLPSQYYSTIEASRGELVRFAEMDDEQYRQMLQPEYVELTQWLNEVIHTPLSASQQRPIDIKMQFKTAEMGFNMRLNRQLSLKALNDLFATQGIALNLQTYVSQPAIWQYLKGEIDLVYQNDNQYHVVDYKSNYLGNQFADYHHDALIKSMDAHRYWLQASIYQVALHRFLKLRVKNYDMDTHLGAVEYAFIRGMSPNLSTTQTETGKLDSIGRLVWQPDNAFILALDALFG